MPTHRPEAAPVDLRQRCLDESGARAQQMPDGNALLRQLTPPNDECDKPSEPRAVEMGLDGPARDIPTPVSTSEDTTSEPDQRLSQSVLSSSAPSNPRESYVTGSLSSPWPRTRFLPNSTSSYLRPGSVFKGTQQSDRQVYEVEVQLQHVDMAESFLCGYLKIQGLTDDHPTLTTYFEGEIIGTKYTFQTKHPEWGSTDKVDMQHWGRFPAWRPLSKQAKTRADFSTKNFAQRENIFMRWKEYFLVPDHRVRTISGASFEGFYYICFNQVTGSISGIYFHAKSEKYVHPSIPRRRLTTNAISKISATRAEACRGPRVHGCIRVPMIFTIDDCMASAPRHNYSTIFPCLMSYRR
jgi:hypothetical protein